MGAEKEKGGDLGGGSEDRYAIPLTIRQKIWFLFVIPTSLCCVIYIADIATDIALVERHYSDSRCLAAILTFVLIYAPAVVFFLITVLDDNKWPAPEDGTFAKVKWILKQLGLLILFPINAMHRFAGRLFWSLEALRCPENEQEEALLEASKPSTAELYLLLQAFFQAAPQAFLQTFILASYKVPHERTGPIQVLGILTSIISAAIAAGTYMRFESQRIAGRRTPWSTKKLQEKVGLEPKESLMTTIESQITSDTAADNSPAENPPEEDPGSPKPPPLPKGVPQTAILSLPPLPPQIRARLIKASGDELPEELQKDYENTVADGEPLNIRTSIYGPNAKSPVKDKDQQPGDVTTLDFMILPPLSPAPPPPSGSPPPPPPPPPFPLDIPMDDDELPDVAPPEESNPEEDSSSEQGSTREAPVAVAETANVSEDHSPTVELRIEEHLSSEPLLDQSTATLQVKPASPTKNYTSIPLPTRKWKIEGLGEDDVFGKITAVVAWFLFITSRVLTLATLAFFCPWAFTAVVLLHYLGMVSYLFYCGKSEESSTTLLRLGLGFVFLFCFIEIRTRFKNSKKFVLGFVGAGAAENVISSFAWYFLADWSSWWFFYTFFLIIITLILSITAMGLYFFVFKPTIQSIYTD